MPSLQQQRIAMDAYLRRRTDAIHAFRLLSVVDDMISWSQQPQPSLEVVTRTQKQTAIRFAKAGVGKVVWQVYAHTKCIAVVHFVPRVDSRISQALFARLRTLVDPKKVRGTSVPSLALDDFVNPRFRGQVQAELARLIPHIR